MKTSEFIKEMHSLGYETTNLERSIIVNDDNGFFLVDVSKERFGVFSTEFAGFYGLDTYSRSYLLDRLVIYAKTPVNEREDEKRYYLKLKAFSTGDIFLNFRPSNGNFFMSDKLEIGCIKTQFTQSEIDNMPECYTHPAVWEQIEVECEE